MFVVFVTVRYYSTELAPDMEEEENNKPSGIFRLASLSVGLTAGTYRIS